MTTTIERCLIDEVKKEYHCTDDEGNFSKYILYKDHRYCVEGMLGDLQERCDSIEKFSCRDDDIVLMTFPKSGSHWLANIVSMLVNSKPEYIGTPPVLEYYVDMETFNRLPSPRLLLSHLPFELIPKGFKTNKSKIISIYRNPKDTMVSLFTFSKGFKEKANFYRGNWNGFFNFALSGDVIGGTWFKHIKMWGSVMKEFSDKEILFISFEDMKKNLYENVVKISKFLGIERSDELYRDIEKHCTFSYMKENVNKGRKRDPNFTELTELGYLPIYRKGEIGDWKNWFTVAQNEAFDAVYEQEMKDCDISDFYTPSYE